MSKEEDKKEETPEPKKDNRFIGFVKRHRKGLIIGSAITATGVVLTVVTRQAKLTEKMMAFIEEQDLADQFLGLEAPTDSEE